jgi:hypothetical protein
MKSLLNVIILAAHQFIRHAEVTPDINLDSMHQFNPYQHSIAYSAIASLSGSCGRPKANPPIH